MHYEDLHAHIEGTVSAKTLLYLFKKYSNPKAIFPDYVTEHYQETIRVFDCMLSNNASDSELEAYLTNRLVLNEPAKTLLEFLRRMPSRFLKYFIRSKEDLVYVGEGTLKQFGPEYERVEIIFVPKSIENEWLTDNEIVEIFSTIWQNHSRKDKFSFSLSLRRTKEDISIEYVSKVVEEYSKYADKGITKLDICDNEDAVSFMDLASQLDILSTAKQQLTLHLGETTPRDMDFILDNYPNVKQFNHGIQAAFDQEIIDKIKRNDVLLTLCPLSNIFTGVLSEIKVLEAIRIFKENGVRYVICSDDATIINGDVYAPYKYLQEKDPQLLQF